MFKTAQSRLKILLIPLLSGFISACAGQLPPPLSSPYSHFLAATNNPLTRLTTEHRQQHDKALSGLYMLDEGGKALAARLQLIRDAEASIDAQYYYLLNDKTGKFFLAHLLQAAERGVRVRLLLDDMRTQANEEQLASLDLHRNIEIKLFNPFAHRSLRLLSFATELHRVNRRMHNKALIIDQAVAIIGGRNIGDQYFDAREDINFSDLDLLAIGDSVEQSSTAFDHYWNHKLAYPVSHVKQSDEKQLQTQGRELQAHVQSKDAQDYLQELPRFELAALLDSNAVYWCPATVLYDSPDKADPEALPDQRYLLDQLGPTTLAAKEEVVIVSPYFVPRTDGLNYVRSMIDQGVTVIIVTNSLASTDVSAAHVGYSRYRRKLLQSGAQIYEMKPRSEILQKRRLFKHLGESSSSLHTKAYVFDRQRIFVGSLNLDPRSEFINTEMGILSDCPSLAAPAVEDLLEELQVSSYRVTLVKDKQGRDALSWQDLENKHLIYSHEPETSAWLRFKTDLLRLLPIEKQL